MPKSQCSSFFLCDGGVHFVFHIGSSFLCDWWSTFCVSHRFKARGERKRDLLWVRCQSWWTVHHRHDIIAPSFWSNPAWNAICLIPLVVPVVIGACLESIQGRKNKQNPASLSHFPTVCGAEKKEEKKTMSRLDKDVNKTHLCWSPDQTPDWQAPWSSWKSLGEPGRAPLRRPTWEPWPIQTLHNGITPPRQGSVPSNVAAAETVFWGALCTP